MSIDTTRPFRGAEAVRAGELTRGRLRGPGFRRLAADTYVAAGTPACPLLTVEAALVRHGPRDIDRLDALRRAGWIVVVVTASQTRRWNWVASRAREALLSRGCVPGPTPRAEVLAENAALMHLHHSTSAGAPTAGRGSRGA